MSIFDPSTLKNFAKWEALKSWFRNHYSNIPGQRIISLNEDESEIFFSNISRNEILNQVDHVIMHTSKVVEILAKNEKIHLNVPPLSPPFATFVGIGDTFNAGLCIGLATGHSIKEATKQGIQWAQNLLLKGWKEFSSRPNAATS